MNGTDVLFFIACGLFGGWIANIYKLATCGLSLGEWGAMEVLRTIGVFMAPLGGVLGFF